MLSKPAQQIPTMMSAVHTLINKWAGANARHVGVAITETNGTIDPDTSPEGLFAADDYLTLMENGVFNVDCAVPTSTRRSPPSTSPSRP